MTQGTRTVEEAILNRRSIRRYQGNPVPLEELVRLVELGVWAPSGGNAQTWRFVIVTQPEIIRALHAVAPGMLSIPPAIIAICQDKQLAFQRGGKLGQERASIMDAAMAAQNIMLAAFAHGLGTCSILSFHREAVARILELPDGVEPELLITIGKPAEQPVPPNRTLSGVVFVNRYGEVIPGWKPES